MSAQPRVSCVIPVFNGERYLPAAIESVLIQTAGPIEIIVVDDGSFDCTRIVTERFGSYVRYAYQSNSGPAAARNRGIEMATGDCIAFLDADDLWHPYKIEIQLARFLERPELFAATAHMQNFWSDDDDDDLNIKPEPAFLERSQLGTASTFIARRELFDRVGKLNPDYRHRDIQDLMVRAMDQGLALEALEDVLVQRRIHAYNMSHDRGGDDQLELASITGARLLRRGTVEA